MGSTRYRALVERYRDDRRAVTALLAPEFLSPILDLDLTLQQLKIVLLVAAGKASSGKSLAEGLGVTPATVSASVDKLVTLGYLERHDDDPDRRVKRLTPTTKASLILERITDHREASEEILTSIPLDDLEALARGVSALREAIERHRAS